MIYFDNAATTKIDKNALQDLEDALLNNYGNASTHYSIGVNAHKLLESSRSVISKCLNCNSQNIIFTSGGTESNNISIQSYLKRFISSDEIICSSIEHDSILNILKNCSHVCKVIFIKPNPDGVVDAGSIISKITKNTKLIILQLINNELGTLQPVKEISDFIKNKNILFHVDAVQAVGHINIDLNDLKYVSSLSASAHKFNGPKGIGFLYAQDLDLSLSFGGGQELGIRPGTENVPSVVSMARALNDNFQEIDLSKSKIGILIEFLEKELLDIPQIKINGKHNCYHSIINFQVEGLSNEALINYFDLQGICVSAGSACDGKNMIKSHVLKAIGLNDEQINSSIRISLSKDNTQEECEIFIKTLKMAIKKLSK